jgi:hypothetical protein
MGCGVSAHLIFFQRAAESHELLFQLGQKGMPGEGRLFEKAFRIRAFTTGRQATQDTCKPVRRFFPPLVKGKSALKHFGKKSLKKYRWNHAASLQWLWNADFDHDFNRSNGCARKAANLIFLIITGACSISTSHSKPFSYTWPAIFSPRLRPYPEKIAAKKSPGIPPGGFDHFDSY